ncbi:MAG: alpha/beta hydrolase [Alphaproteobacteria bacterium]|nr:alpha/beta hydrolase [Alphaproteobacteria bacterium]HCP00879.1 alpha/beta hydrolase [Rhodospirillaceae bacterium]
MDVYVDDQAVFVHTGGRAFESRLPTLVFVHGGGNDHSAWGMQARYFAHHGYNVLAPDLPGHGRSDGVSCTTIDEFAEWLWRFVEAVGADVVYFAGHSMGSLIVLAAAAKDPARAGALILLGPSDHMKVHPDLLAMSAANDPAAFEMITDWGFGKSAHKGGHQAPGLWLRGGGRALLASCPTDVLGSDLAACNNWTGALEAAVEICCPTLFLMGAGDRMTPVAASQGLRAAITGARTEILANTGHMIMVECPNETINAISEFLDDIQ